MKEERPHVNIAVLGDLHGHITLAYRVLRRWEKEHEETIDLILQVGDLGAYPFPEKADKTTKRFARKDPDELSFQYYYTGFPEGDEILGSGEDGSWNITSNMYFIKGNHDDFEFLDEMSYLSSLPVPVDRYERIFFMRNGMVTYLQAANHRIKTGCLGGQSLHGGPGHEPVSKYYTRAEVDMLHTTSEGLDIFLSHDAPRGALSEDRGSREVIDFIDIYQPRYHFCGHMLMDGQELEVPRKTRSFFLSHVNFKTGKQLNPGCIGILSWTDQDNNDFTFLDEIWMGNFTRSNYHVL